MSTEREGRRTENQTNGDVDGADRYVLHWSAFFPCKSGQGWLPPSQTRLGKSLAPNHEEHLPGSCKQDLVDSLCWGLKEGNATSLVLLDFLAASRFIDHDILPECLAELHVLDIKQEKAGCKMKRERPNRRWIDSIQEARQRFPLTFSPLVSDSRGRCSSPSPSRSRASICPKTVSMVMWPA